MKQSIRSPTNRGDSAQGGTEDSDSGNHDLFSDGPPSSLTPKSIGILDEPKGCRNSLPDPKPGYLDGGRNKHECDEPSAHKSATMPIFKPAERLMIISIATFAGILACAVFWVAVVQEKKMYRLRVRYI